MGIETRKNGNAYYYRKMRRNGRVVSEYVSGGEFGALMYHADQLMRAQQAEQQAARRAELAELRRLDAEARDLARDALDLAAAALLAVGYHRHKGTWRRRRAPAMPQNLPPSAGLLATLAQKAQAEQKRRRAQVRPALPEPEPAELAPVEQMSAEDVRALMKRCDQPEASAEDVRQLRALLRKRGQNLTGDGSMIRQALEREIRDMNATPLGRELVADDTDRRRRALGYDEAPALEKPLIDHLLMCELRMGLAEQHYTTKLAGGLTLDAARYWEGRLNAAQRRYLGAVDALARVRRVRVELARVTAPDGTRAELAAVERPGA